MNWLLIIVVVGIGGGGGTSIQTVPMETQAICNAAQQAVSHSFRYGITGSAVCVKVKQT